MSTVPVKTMVQYTRMNHGQKMSLVSHSKYKGDFSSAITCFHNVNLIVYSKSFFFIIENRSNIQGANANLLLYVKDIQWVQFLWTREYLLKIRFYDRKKYLSCWTEMISLRLWHLWHYSGCKTWKGSRRLEKLRQITKQHISTFPHCEGPYVGKYSW